MRSQIDKVGLLVRVIFMCQGKFGWVHAQYNLVSIGRERYLCIMVSRL